MDRFRRILSAVLLIYLLFWAFPVNCENITWDCTECGRTGNTGNYCGGCSNPAPWVKESQIPSSVPSAASIEVGNIVTFGRYHQSSYGIDYSPIEWLVLDVQENKALLISRYGLDCQPYNSNREDITWEKCTLRTWLNDAFLNKAFTIAEQAAILTSVVDNSEAQGYSEYNTVAGEYTLDKIFLLSYAEAWKYFSNDSARQCMPTEYITAQKEHQIFNGYCWWWLRSPGDSQDAAAAVFSNGSRDHNAVSQSHVAVRPAMWIDLDFLFSAAASGSGSVSCKILPRIGSFIDFGHYPQSFSGQDNTSIEWIVLDVQGNKALLISRYGLDCQTYNSNNDEITWETCTLRAWLNDVFLDKAFTSDEQKEILITEVDNGESQRYIEYNLTEWNNTQDKVFLLSYAEAWSYFRNDSVRQCQPTEYAVTQKAYIAGNNNCWWWLRSPGGGRKAAAVVFNDGSRDRKSAVSEGIAVRPAIWVDLNSGIF